jgi:CRP-like cAMP-binding protein
MGSLAPLDRIGWLSAQPEFLQDWALRVGRWRTYKRGQALYEVDQSPDAVYGLADGCLEISVPLACGEIVGIYVAESGSWLGESAILARAKRTMSVNAVSESLTFRIAAEDIMRLLERHPNFWPCFCALSHANATLSITEYARAMAFSTEAHVCWMLLRLSKSTERVSLTQAKIAELLGVTRSTVQRILLELASRGVIAVSYGSITVLDRLKLRELVKD